MQARFNAGILKSSVSSDRHRVWRYVAAWRRLPEGDHGYM